MFPVVVAAAFVVPLAALLILAALDVPLGEREKLFYRYSPWRGSRAERALPAILLLAPLAWVAVVVAAQRRGRELLFVAVLSVLLVGIGTWNLLAPPAFLAQHTFNLVSPAQDGAFVLETGAVTDVPVYLGQFNDRIQHTVMEMNGARVISNPPGMTVVAALLRPSGVAPPSDVLSRYLLSRVGFDDAMAALAVTGARLGLVLQAAWVASGILAYALARLYLPRAASVLFALVVTFNPSTAHFSPGKDAAQLLLVNAMLLTWFAGWQRRSPWLGVVCGAMFAIATTFTLLSLWIAAIALAASTWEALGDSSPRTRALLLRQSLAACAGAAIMSAGVYFVLDFSLPSTVWALARRFPGIQRELQFDRSLWLIIGIPIFLQFVSPAIWILAARRKSAWAFGNRLLVCTIAAMALTFVTGVAYELPRLWIAFLPLLTLGVMTACRPRLVSTAHPGRAARALALIAAVHVVFTVAHWTVLDVRESEHRLEKPTIFRL